MAGTTHKSVAIQTESKLSIDSAPTRHTSFNSKLEIAYDKQEASFPSFQQWHLRMQKEHQIRTESNAEKPILFYWHWCNRLFLPCRYIDSIDNDKKICRCCLKFRTFKTWTTGFLIAGFVYLILFEIIGEDILPGKTYFLLLSMFVAAFLIGNLFINIGLPPTVGQILVGIAFRNMPLYREEEKVMLVTDYSEKIIIVIVIIRAALRLEFSHLHDHFRVIMQYALVPYVLEFSIVVLCARFLLLLPWEWSALMGALLSPASLAAVVSNLEKNKKLLMRENNNKLTTILIAASSVHVTISLYSYSALIAFIFSKGLPWAPSWWAMLLIVLLQILCGFLLGIILGCIVGMFPDRRSAMAPYNRILFTGTVTIALILVSHSLGITGVGVLGSLTMVFMASNMWSELGWRESSNPVVYFYSVLYYLVQPAAVSLAGFSMNFANMDPIETGIITGTVVLGLTIKEVSCFLVTWNKSYQMTWSEKIFICICWMPKGASEALLAAALRQIIRENYHFVSDRGYSLTQLLHFADVILHTTVIGILLSAPLSSLLMFISRLLLNV